MLKDSASRGKPFASSPEQLRALTSLRFFAAMLVVCYHCGMEAGYPRWSGDLFRNGYEAVSFFFVLSGFILTYVYARDEETTFSRSRFWAARIARICPVYYLALLIDFPRVIYSALAVHTTPLPKFFGALLSTPLFLQSWIPTVESVWNIPAWSLSVEAFFYALFPFIVVRLRTTSPRKLLAWSLGAVVVVGVGRTLVAAQLANGDLPILSTIIRIFPLMHLPQFLLGIAIARVFATQTGGRPLLAELVFVSAGAAVLTIFWLRSSLPPIALSDALLAPLYGLLICAAAQSVGPMSGILSRRLLVGLGEISYGVYILHIPLYLVWARVLERIIHTRTLPAAAIWSFIIPLIIACWIIYRFIEKPLRKSLMLRCQNWQAAALGRKLNIAAG